MNKLSNLKINNKEVLRDRIYKNPDYFFKKVLSMTTWSKMLDIANSVRDFRRTAVSGCTASSKTYTASAIVPWWLLSHGNPSRVITFAPTGRQVEMNMWGYVPIHIRNAVIPLGGELLGTTWRLDKDWYATGFSSDNPDNVKGIHGKNDLIIFDDGQGIGIEIYRSLELIMAGGSAHLLVLFNKDNMNGEVYDMCHKKRSLYNHIGISAYDTPNVQEGKEVIVGMITRDQVNEWINTYGEDDDFVRVYVRNEFPKQQDNILISMDWIEQAVARQAVYPTKQIHAGLDVARMGRDQTVLCLIRGLHVLSIHRMSKYDTMEVVAFTREILDSINYTSVSVDEIGIGAGVLDRLTELGYNASGVNVSRGQKDIEDLQQAFASIEYYCEIKNYKFFNLRSLIWWLIRMALNPKNIQALTLPNNSRLIEELSTIRYKIDSDKTIRIEDKEITKTRLRRSPDSADAVCLANFGRLCFSSVTNRNLISIME